MCFRVKPLSTASRDIPLSGVVRLLCAEVGTALLKSSSLHTRDTPPKNHLLTLKLLQTCVSFFLLLNTKEDIFVV